MQVEVTDSSMTIALSKPLSDNCWLTNLKFIPGKQKWLYGFRFTNKLRRRLAEKRKLDWQKNPFGVSVKLMDYVRRKSRAQYKLRAVMYKEHSALILAFFEDDERRRSERNPCSERQMERVRKVLGLPEGTKPKWYELSGRAYDEGAEDSEDEEFPMKT